MAPKREQKAKKKKRVQSSSSDNEGASPPRLTRNAAAAISNIEETASQQQPDPGSPYSSLRSDGSDDPEHKETPADQVPVPDSNDSLESDDSEPTKTSTEALAKKVIRDSDDPDGSGGADNVGRQHTVIDISDFPTPYASMLLFI
ncbi:hypothetical protein ColLi_08320 [Colletotrichum liriopes]|uniref:Uncharacterized protein n=1 Tax=Colletotrichum liriopes TaxID=708192 RepID=A0AA37LV06_9PEZI|nr:hypothetical protein ColLi_08320 [Colletotrichum liriopes]